MKSTSLDDFGNKEIINKEYLNGIEKKYISHYEVHLKRETKSSLVPFNWENYCECPYNQGLKLYSKGEF
jgi:hypothetical protein